MTTVSSIYFKTIMIINIIIIMNNYYYVVSIMKQSSLSSDMYSTMSIEQLQ